MSHPNATVALPDRLPFPAAGKVVGALLALTGMGAFGYLLSSGHEASAWSGWLIGMFYFLGLGVFGVLWVSIQYLTRAAWSVPTRRIPEAMAAWVLPSVVLAPLTWLGAHSLYHWSHAEAVAADELLTHKSPFLNMGGFVGGLAGVLAVYGLLAFLLLRNSRRQDETGKAAHTSSNVRLAALFTLFFAPSWTVVCYYLLMSLEPHWFSTMFGVLCFTDIMQTGLALVALVVAFFVHRGLLKGYLDVNHLHDVTKMAYAFTGFWAYIYFCQYMLIWYANIPEETVYFLHRSSNGWEVWLLALPVLKFLVPFVLLTPRGMKRKPVFVMFMMGWLLVAQFVELFVMVAPALSHGGEAAHAYVPGWEIAVFLGFAGAFYLVVNAVLSRHGAVPVKDPCLRPSMHHHI